MMEEESVTQELRLHVNGEPGGKFSTFNKQRSHSYSWRLRVSLYVFLLLAGETIATLLGRLYYDKGGNSTWLETLVQLVGFPLTIPCYYFIKPEPSKIHTFYTQLACLLTISSTLLVIQPDHESSISESSAKYNYVIGYICAICSSAGYSLVLSLMDYVFENVLKESSFKKILDMDRYPSLVATCAVLVGLFASGGWQMLRTEMEEFKLGKSSYILIALGSTVSWQAFSIGSLGLILEISSLFSNVIGTLGLPVVPILGVVFFKEEMSGIKLIAMVLAIWGFVSYAYQHYIDDRKPEEVDHEKEEEQEFLQLEEEEAKQDNSHNQA
ncbi:unnamed protein product [Microthlaspi erraticum]|uniref:Probable purine permease n=1 Tax=Microthlaspi erraticum TaxID=1685480 RepID=A0A6D2JPB0_9BRAS|nr:unnamed protein product [Microthlaspi erraticum]